MESEAAPYIAMLMAECCQVGLMIISKQAMNTGMTTFVFVSYSNALASLILLPFSLFFHRSPPFSHFPSISSISLKLKLKLTLLLGLIADHIFPQSISLSLDGFSCLLSLGEWIIIIILYTILCIELCSNLLLIWGFLVPFWILCNGFVLKLLNYGLLIWVLWYPFGFFVMSWLFLFVI